MSHPPTIDVDVSLPTPRPGGTLQVVLLCGLCALLAFAILAFGATREWGTVILQLGAAGLFLLWIASQVGAGELHLPDTPLLLPMIGLGLTIVVQLAFKTSAYAYATRKEFLVWLAYGFVFIVGAGVLSRESAIRKFLAAVTAFGAALSTFAVVQSLTAGGKIYWRVLVTTVAQPYGPYINHSHYAGLMEMLAPFGLVLCLDPYLSGTKRVLAGFAGLMMAASIVFCRSRGGIVSLICELAFFAGYVLLSTRQRRGIGWQAGILAAALLAAIAWIGPADVLEHMATLKAPLNPEVSGDRLTIARDSMRMFRDRPLLGWGLDVFPIAYPKYRSFATEYRINAAHNDYVQLLVETGIVGFSILLVFLGLLYRKGFRNLRESKSPFRSDAVLAALVGCTGLLVHSLSDFNLHIPANAAVFFVLCAIVTVTPVSQAGSSRHFHAGERRRSRVRREELQESGPLLIEGYREDN